MKYGITRRILGCNTFINLSLGEFDEANIAKTNLMHALFIEEKLNYVLESFFEFERELLDMALDNILLSDMAWSASVNEVHTVNRRILNLLAACRLYVDHVAHSTCTIYGKGLEFKAFKEKTSTEYDSHLGYRAIEAMRNYVQHRGFPVHCVNRTSQRVDTEDGLRAKHTVIPKVKVAALAADKKFKSSVLQELQELGEEIDFRPLIREYIESIGRIHLHIRETLQDDIPIWEAVMKQVVMRYREVGGEDTVGLAVVAEDESGNNVGRVEVFDDFMTRRQELERKNRHLTHCASHFVTSEA